MTICLSLTVALNQDFTTAVLGVILKFFPDIIKYHKKVLYIVQTNLQLHIIF